MAIEKNQTKKFQNLTVDYTKIIGKMSVSDRMAMLRSNEGQTLLSSLTPYQLAEMFPDYYKRQYPDVGALLKSVSSPSFKPLSREQAEASMSIDRKRLGAGERSYLKPEVKPGWLRKMEEETGVTLSDPGAKAKLSSEKKALLEELAKGNISADDPRVAFLKDISKDDLLKAGIEIVGDGENKQFRQIPIEVSQEEIEKARKSTITGANNQEVVMKAFADELRKKGVPEENLPYAVAALSGQVKQESGFNPTLSHDNNTGYGIYGARDPQPGRGRKTDMLKWLEANGYSKDSAEGQARYMVNEAMSGKFPQTRNSLLTANKDNVDDVTSVLVDEFERPKERERNKRVRSQHSRSYLDAATTIAGAPEIPSNANDEVIEAALKEKKKAERETYLAEKAIPKLPEGVDNKIVETFNKLSPGQKQDFLQMLEKAGNGDMSKGVSKLNELHKQNPTLVQEAVFQNKGNLLFSDASVEGRAAQLNPHMQNSLNKFQEFAPRGTTITSTYRSPEHEIERNKPGGPGAHSRGSAVDIRTRDKSPEELAQTIQALKRAGFTKILLEDDHIHAESNPGQSFHITNLGQGNPTIDLRTAQEAASVVAFNEELPGNQQNREQPTQVVQQSVAQPVDVYAEGGKHMLASGEIKAMPIESLKGDNSVVVDAQNKPLFTMNTKEEQAIYNPKTRQVEVQPLTKTDPNTIGEKQNQNTEAMMKNDNIMAKQYIAQPTYTPETNQQVRSTDTSVAVTDELFKDPSFKRAIAKTRFVDTGDAALGGHFGMANADLG